MRRRTRIGQTTLADAATQAEKFSVAVREKMKELKFSKVFNADQTGAVLLVVVYSFKKLTVNV
ncbi:hypothetical protein PC129_g22741 [Phytophthora cactorum]|uniref:Uncharacterized protein n=1 Tax=Phytophthora cactorum TaxID=29920 RepID=A0A8T0Y8W2_9STRA|nr:hypothetical protein Pcac1_g25989 [Phytophthora cactorum]KAG2834831.1 hypothetical protein PC113_g20319 [Phytophthora cactorum]KAG2879988.1 hypothetical protein PC114_g22283 [Phytophthora cactorum]KAG2899791.1 hypothetical protein PC117_g22142 [Phytophthora cactorum]KAG2962191.1 hypothetical protein PC119_g25880 [Phytophthora cactorum]